MNNVIIDNITYERLIPLNIGKYEYLFVLHDNKVYYVQEKEGTYEFPNEDLTLKGNVNIPLSNLNSRIIMSHIKKILDNDITSGLIPDKNIAINRLNQIQRILSNNELYILIKGSVNSLNNFDYEVSKLIDKFDELYNGLTGYMPKKNIEKKEINEVKKEKVLDENANVDTIMIAMLANIGILMFIMFILNIIR